VVTAAWRTSIAVLLLVAQGGVAIWQHERGTRYFAWAPNDYFVTYDLHVHVGRRALTAPEVARRYRLDLTGFLSPTTRSELGLAQGERYVWEDPPRHLTERIERYEESYGTGHPVRVKLDYQLDAGKLQTWRWPR
jgi:hypothetical protein